MARIRTIKPDFWTDSKVVQLPFAARLLFVGLWNFADDDGYILDEPDRIKMQILPADVIDVEIFIDLLVAAELVARLEAADGRQILSIPNFARHQKISHRTPTKLPVEGATKKTIPLSVRREVAVKHGCAPGKEHAVQCYYCGSAGMIHWFPLSNGRPSSWVAFSGVEIDHFIPENSGGLTEEKNLVLACRYCNRSKKVKAPLEFIIERHSIHTPENAGGLRPEGKGREEEEESAAPNGAPRPDEQERQLFSRGKEVLGRTSGGLIASLLKAKSGSVQLARAAIEQAATKENAREYIGSIIRARGAVTASGNAFPEGII